jgi:transcriptional regulator with XRE-family HTH domain
MLNHAPVTPATIGARLLALRQLFGAEALSQRRLARLASLSPPYVGLLETGAIANPGADKIASIARVVSRSEAEETATLAWLISGTGEHPTAAQVAGGIARAERSAEERHA